MAESETSWMMAAEVTISPHLRVKQKEEQRVEEADRQSLLLRVYLEVTYCLGMDALEWFIWTRQAELELNFAAIKAGISKD